MAGPPTGTVTFLFTDIEGSTKMWERNPEAMRAAHARHDEILHTAIAKRDGFVFKVVGDAFCAAFSIAPEALEAALEAQRALLEEPWTEEIGLLKVRMALHTGVAEERGGDYLGPPLNRVARLLSAAHGGQVLFSLPTQELVRDQLPSGVALRDLGERHLKDLFRPERVFQLIAPDLPAEFPPLRTLDAYRTNLPVQPTPLVGREREVAQVCELLRSPEVRLLTLTGPGGTGKTRVGLQAAAELLEEYEDGAFFVALATIDEPALVASTVAQALGVTETGDQSLEEKLQDYLRERETLILLDNFEQVMEATPLLDELLSAASRLKVLATSRATLRLYGEHEFPVPPLELPDPRRLPPPERLTQYEAVRLFVERARAVKPDFSVTNENAPEVAEICARLDGLPLAIELAAARIRLLPPQAILSRLGSRLKLLTGGARNLPERQRTLRGAIEWSYDLLDEEEKLLFARLGVFAGGRTLEAIETICDPEGELNALDAVESLLEKSLLRQEEGPEGEPRFTMLETIHEYARERLEVSGEAEEIRRAHAEYFVALAEEAEPETSGPQQVEWLDRLEAEHDNLRTALSWSLGAVGDHELGLRLAGALSGFWFIRGYLGEGRRWVEEALHKSGPTLAAARAKALLGLGVLVLDQGDYERVSSSSEEALTLYRELGDKRGVADALLNLGWVDMYRGNDERATSLLEESLAVARESGDDGSTAAALNGIAILTADRGDLERAEALWEESAALGRKLGDRRREISCLNNMSYAQLVRGDYERAEALCQEVLEINKELKDHVTPVLGLIVLGIAATRRGDLERARALLRESLALSRKLGVEVVVAECLESMAGLAGAQGEIRRAARLWGAADALREAMGAPWLPLERRVHESYLAATRTQLAEAEWTEAWEEGRSMSLEQAVYYALEDGEEHH